MLALIAVTVYEWVLIGSLVVTTWSTVQPLIRKPIAAALTTTAHATEKVGRTVARPVRHPVATAKKLAHR
jgi:hypothetical protein